MAADFVAGTLGGIAGVVVGYPADKVKVRLQSTLLDASGARRYHGTWHCFSTIVRQETVLGLYRGMSSPIAAVGVINSMVFGVYGHFLRLQHSKSNDGSDRPSIKQVFLAGMGSGFINSFVACPVELAKIRLQNQAASGMVPLFNGPLGYLQHQFRLEGLRGCYRGIAPTILRETPSYGVYFAAYEVGDIKHSWMVPSEKTVDDLGWKELLLAGGLSGIAGWVCIYPIDVVKTKMQAESPGAYRHMVDCFQKSYRAHGLRIFGTGLVATILRAFPTNAATLFIYTISMRLLQQPEHFDAETRATATAALE